MPAAADGSVLGDNCQLHYSATLGGSGALTEVPVIIDDAINSERRSAESNCRGDSEITEHVGKPKHSISANLLFKRGTPGATFVTLRNAYNNGTVLHFALTSGAIADTGQHVFRLEGKIKSWNETRPDNDTVKVAIEIAKDAGNTYASNWSVVSS
jgi:hypothetical protein